MKDVPDFPDSAAPHGASQRLQEAASETGEGRQSTCVQWDELEAALMWVSTDFCTNQAFISVERGTIHWLSDLADVPDDPPDDIEDGTLYVAVPAKNDLDLGSALVKRFARHLPARLESEVREIFSRRGAYARFRALLEREGVSQAWYEFEGRETEEALRFWATEQGFVVIGARRVPGNRPPDL